MNTLLKINNHKGVFICVFLLLGSLTCFGQKTKLVRDGRSIGAIKIGTSTESNVIENYGSQYRLVDHQKYSNEMIYEKTGLSFYYCYNDPKKEIFLVNMTLPYRAKTSKGIILGKSTLEDVFSVYGSSLESTAGFSYPGISFYVAESKVKWTDDKKQTLPANVTKPLTGAFVLDANSSMQSSQVVFKSTSQDKRRYAEELRNLKKQKISSITLFERNGLRQCHVRYAK